MNNLKNLIKVIVIAFACTSVNTQAFGMTRVASCAQSAWELTKSAFRCCFIRCKHRQLSDVEKILVMHRGMQLFAEEGRKEAAKLSKKALADIDNLLKEAEKSLHDDINNPESKQAVAMSDDETFVYTMPSGNYEFDEQELKAACARKEMSEDEAQILIEMLKNNSKIS